jgi:hypothetical protein
MDGLGEILSAFHELSTDRQIGMAAGPIPSASIDRRVTGMSDSDAAFFRRCIRELDNVFLQHIAGDSAPSETQETTNSARDAFRSRMKSNG